MLCLGLKSTYSQVSLVLDRFEVSNKILVLMKNIQHKNQKQFVNEIEELGYLVN